MQLETIRVMLTADHANWVAGMKRAKDAQDGLGGAVGRSSKAINTLKGGMVGLAVQATGTAGPVGKLAQGLLLFGGGSTLILGVAAGIGAVALAYKSLTAESREAKKATDDLIKALQGIGVHGQLTAARIELGKLQENLKVFQDLQARVPTSPSVAAKVVEAQTAIATQLNVIARLQQEVAKWQKGIADDANREAEARRRSLAAAMALDKVKGKLPSKETVEASVEELGLKQLASGLKYEGTLGDLGNKMRYGLEQSGMSEDMRDFGISIGRQFAMGMLEGIQSMQDLFKMVIMSVLDFALGALLGSIFGGPAGAVAGGIKGAAGGSVVAPASMSVSMSMSGLQPLTVFAIARDPNFQQVIREATLVARSQGFKG